MMDTVTERCHVTARVVLFLTSLQNENVGNSSEMFYINQEIRADISSTLKDKLWTTG